MPVATELYQEGVIIPPLKLREAGRLNESLFALILRNVRTPAERRGDFDAQLGALSTGAARLEALAARYGNAEVARWMEELTDYAERLTRAALAEIPDGDYAGLGRDGGRRRRASCRSMRARVAVAGDDRHGGLRGVGQASRLPPSTPVAAVTRSAVAYCVRCLLPARCSLRTRESSAPSEVLLPEASIVNARPQRAVSAGNVETSQRVTDVVLAAFAEALPERIPAASAGTMSNFTFGGVRENGEPFAYYETVPGGSGRGARRRWARAVSRRT